MFNISEVTLKKLEFKKIIALLEKECSSSLGKNFVEKIGPITKIDKITELQGEVTEAVDVRRIEVNIPLIGMSNLDTELRKMEIEAVLEAEECLRILDNLVAARKIKNFLLKDTKYRIPRLEALAENIYILKNIEDEISSKISKDAELLDSASEKLFSIKKRIKNVKKDIRLKLENIIKSTSNQKYLQDSLVTIRNERYVVPVRQEYRQKIPGMIHDQSSSGATLFIEPMSVVNMNNDLKELRLKENEEIIRILTELTERISFYKTELKNNQYILGNLDFIFAKAKLSEKMEAVAPEISEKQIITIKQGRHPLISKEDVVPLDINLGYDFDTLIITGPNTGGKTVTLKTVGLFVLMAQSGLHIPAEPGSRVGIFENVFVDIGDEQSIEQSLSTFSSHMTNIIDILSKINNKSLVLLDELGAGTDPIEGAALAEAILRVIISKGCKTIATTHYGELKTFAYQEERIQNASVEFDLESLRPTYRLLIGVPGKSNALEIVKVLGLPDEVISIAEDLRVENEKDVENLLKSLEEHKIDSEIAKNKAESIYKEAQSKLREAEERLLELDKKKEKMIRRAEEEALYILKEAREKSDRIIDEIKEIDTKAYIEAKEKKSILDDKADSLTKNILKAPKVYKKNKTQKIEVGDNVFVPKFNQKGVVLELSKDQKESLVQIGIIKVNLKLEDILLTEEDKEEKKSTVSALVSNKSKNISIEYDFRGFRVEEALDGVDKYLDDAYLAGLPQVFLIHGKGEGILRQAVREFLHGRNNIKNIRDGHLSEGGSGVTVVDFK